MKSFQRIKAALMVGGSQSSALQLALGADYGLEQRWERELFWNTQCFQAALDPAGMEGPASTCSIKHCKPLSIAGNPPGLGQSLLSRTVRQERSNSASKGALPIIPEYPGFQDVKVCMPKLSLQSMVTATYSCAG